MGHAALAAPVVNEGVATPVKFEDFLKWLKVAKLSHSNSLLAF